MDKYKNAIGLIKACGLNVEFGKELMQQARQIENTIVLALEKQIPKKPNIPWDTQRPQCPICQSGFLGEPKYCDECGQALDWSD